VRLVRLVRDLRGLYVCLEGNVLGKLKLPVGFSFKRLFLFLFYCFYFLPAKEKFRAPYVPLRITAGERPKVLGRGGFDPTFLYQVTQAARNHITDHTAT